MAGHYARSLSFTRNWSLNLSADLADPAIAVGPRNTTDDDPTIKFFEADLAQAWALPHDDDIHESAVLAKGIIHMVTAHGLWHYATHSCYIPRPPKKLN